MKQRPTRPAKRKKTELFVKVMLETLDAPAWRAMSAPAAYTSRSSADAETI